MGNGAQLYSLRKLEGVVLAVTYDWFRARIQDIMDRSKPEEIALIEVASIHEAYQPCIVVGAIFEWSLCYDMTGGLDKRRRKVSKFVFKSWTRDEIEATRKPDDDK